MEVRSWSSWLLRLPSLRTSADKDGAQFEIVGVTLESDGETGSGFCWVGDTGVGSSVRALLDDVLLPRLAGRSALDAAAIWQETYLATHRAGDGVNRFAMSAIDIALWDLRARTRGISLAREIGQLRETVPAYGSGKAGVKLDIDQLVELSTGYAAQGFHGVKVRVGLEPARDGERIRAVRAAVGDDVKIMCDANERLDLPTALELGRTFVDAGVHWFEEPLRSTDIDGHAQLAATLPLAIAGGEHHHSASGFVPYAQRRAFSVFQPNIGLVGGVTEMIRIARLAELHGIAYAPQAIHELHVHLAAATPAATYLEYFPFLEPFLERSVEVRNGDLVVPDGPGHGVAFTEETFDRYRVT